MTIRSKENNTYIIMLIVHLIFFLVGSRFMQGNLIYFWIFAYFLSFYVFFHGWFINGKTIVMDELGCEVSFLWFKRKYSWAEFKTKRLGLYLINSGLTRKGVVFSTKRIGEMNCSHPVSHAGFIPYLGYFYVIFPPEEKNQSLKEVVHYYMIPYEVNEEEFMKKMKEWNVWIENGLPKNKHWSEW